MYPYKARCDSQLAAKIIGCPLQHISRFSRDGLIPRLNPGQKNVVAYFPTGVLLALANSPKWLVAATAHVSGKATPGQLAAARAAVKEAIRIARPSGGHGAAGSTEWIVNEWIAALFRDPRTGALLPGSLGDDHVARIFGCHRDDVPRLRRLGLLECINPTNRNQPKRHARGLICELATDFKWLSESTVALNNYWRNRNARRSSLADADVVASR